MAAIVDCDWCAWREVVLIGNREQIQHVRHLELPRLRRWSRIALLDTAVARELREDARVEVVDAPLSDVAKCLSDQHKVAIHIANKCREKSLSAGIKGVTLEQFLDLITLKTGIAWDTDGRSIFIGEERAINRNQPTNNPG
jgi:hypothetical protein